MAARPVRYVALAATAMAFMNACGAEAPTEPAAPPPAPAATATATAAPTTPPTPAPTPRPVLTGEEVYPGPVATVRVRLYAVVAPSGQHRPEPFYDARSNTDVAQKGDLVVLDLTPRNASGQKCEAQNDPVWILSNDAGVFSRRPSSNPYLYRADAVGTGVVHVRAIVDGVSTSNFINVEIR
jgi:hypothetical protein